MPFSICDFWFSGVGEGVGALFRMNLNASWWNAKNPDQGGMNQFVKHAAEATWNIYRMFFKINEILFGLVGVQNMPVL